MNELLTQISSQFGLPIWLLSIVLIWSLFWKAVAMWKSARNNHPIWFVIFLLVQTIGIIEILYIFLFSKIKLEDKPVKSLKAHKRNKKR